MSGPLFLRSLCIPGQGDVVWWLASPHDPGATHPPSAGVWRVLQVPGRDGGGDGGGSGQASPCAAAGVGRARVTTPAPTQTIDWAPRRCRSPGWILQPGAGASGGDARAPARITRARARPCGGGGRPAGGAPPRRCPRRGGSSGGPSGARRPGPGGQGGGYFSADALAHSGVLMYPGALTHPDAFPGGSRVWVWGDV
jgi:hypothetical protein